MLGYPVVRDHALGLGLSGTPDAQDGDDVQNQTYKGKFWFCPNITKIITSVVVTIT